MKLSAWKIYIVSITFIMGLLFVIFKDEASSTIQNIMGLAVSTTTLTWTNLNDAARGDALTNGILVNNPYLWNGTSFDRARGTTANGMAVDVTRIQGTIATAPASSGTNFYAIKATNLTTVSVNYAFGFTSKLVLIQALSTNTDDICISYTGGTAVCPAANTAGNDRLAAGVALAFDNFAVTSLSAIAASGTQTLIIRAFN